VVSARSTTAAAVLVALCCSACALDRVAVGEGRDGIVVHSVLNPSVLVQYVVVERVLTGRVPVDLAPPQGDVVAAAPRGGVPIVGAVVRLTRDDGFYAIAAARAPGVYTTADSACNPVTKFCGSTLYLGGGGSSFKLLVTKDGQTVAGATTVPGVVRAYPQILTRDTLDRTRDTLVIKFPPTVDRARYVFRVGNPYGPVQLFTDSTRVYVPGVLVNATADGLPPAFLPGFRQTVVVAAVDENYFDYYRSTNSRFTGAGLISHLEGGTGLFGAMKVLDTRRIETRAPFAGGLDGRYVGGATGRDTLELWAGPTVRDGRLVSGDVRTVLPNDLGVVRFGVLGSIAADRIALRVLSGDSADDVAYTLVGTASDESLSLTGPAGMLTFRRIAR
jgi:hypothetical protein